MNELDAFLAQWTDTESRNKAAFERLLNTLKSLDGVALALNARPGVSYSLRVSHPDQQDRALFAMVDVIDDDPANRWLSVCFYRDLVTDPEELGDEVPEGLLGEDAICFDVDAYEEDLLTYVETRLKEAHAAAAP